MKDFAVLCCRGERPCFLSGELICVSTYLFNSCAYLIAKECYTLRFVGAYEDASEEWSFPILSMEDWLSISFESLSDGLVESDLLCGGGTLRSLVIDLRLRSKVSRAAC